MQIALELRNGKEKVARFQTEVENGEKEFSKLVNSLSSIIFGNIEKVKFEEKLHPEDTYVEEEKVKEQEVKNIVNDFIRPKKYVPEVISDEVVVHKEMEKPKGIQKEIMLVARCECGNTKVFKTLDNSGRKFKCDCGKEYPIENSIRIVATCPNCGNSSHGFRTLKGMDVSDFLTCKQCGSPIDLKFNEKSKQWNNL